MRKTNLYIVITLILLVTSPLAIAKDQANVNYRLEQDFSLSVLVDFIDDALEIHFTPEKVEQMMNLFKQIGVKRVYWQHYGGARADLKLWSGFSSTPASRNTLQSLNGMPINVAVEKAKKVGLEIYAVIRPYENGLSRTIPAGAPQTASIPGIERIGGSTPVVMGFVSDHPEMRIKRRKTEFPGKLHSVHVSRIRLFKDNKESTRITQDKIEIWTSPDNYQYQKKQIRFTFSESIEPADRDFISFGKVITKAGTPIRVLQLDGLNLTDKYILVTTTLKDNQGDFQNLATEMIRAFDSSGHEIPLSVATSFAVWAPDRNFRNDGLAFDTGFGPGKLTLDMNNSSGTQGFIALGRGKNEYLPAALCEAYPEVRNFWMQFVQECLDAGVDGIDFRVQCHSTWTDEPYEFGFNPPIVSEYKKRYGLKQSEQMFDLHRLAELRGEFYTDFMRTASNRIHEAGKKMQVHINTDLLSPDYTHKINPFTYPRNIHFDWEKWLETGIADEVTLRSLVLRPEQLESDPYSQRVIKKCQDLRIPLHYNRYLTQVGPAFKDLQKEIEQIQSDRRFQSFILYEGKRLIGPANHNSVTLRGGRYGTMKQWKNLTNTFYK